MSPTGDADLLVAARSALLDALEALHAHRDAVIVIGAQAIYLHTGAGEVGLAEATKDSDLALDTRILPDEPLLELMIPESLAGPSGRRGARIPPHSTHAARRAAGLEAELIDHAPMVVRALAPGDDRAYAASVAGPVPCR